MAYRRELNYSDESDSSTSTKYSGRSFDIETPIVTPFPPSDPLEEPPYRLHPIQASDDMLIQQWNDFLEDVVMGEVRRLPQWNSVVVLRRGVSYVATECLPTIIISISQDRMGKVYEEMASRLLCYCRDVEIDIAIIIEESEIYRNVRVRNMTERPGLGASVQTSIAVEDQQLGLGAGTLGGYVKLEKPGKAPKICAMTCHHVAVSADEPGLAGEGIVPVNWQHSSRTVVHPASEDMEETLRGARDVNNTTQSRLQETRYKIEFNEASGTRMASLPKEEAAAARTAARVEWFENWPSTLGHVFATSGFKIDAKRGCSIDWALVEVDPSRTGTNNIETVEGYFVPATDTVVECGNFSLNNQAFKFGRSTGFTKGRFSMIRAHCMVSGNPGETTEDVFTSGDMSTPFGLRGDSGSWVLNAQGQLGGLLLAGQEGKSFSYVTPISIVLADIEARLECKVSLVS